MQDCFIVRSRLGMGMAVALALANPLLHKTISDFFDGFVVRWGFKTYDHAMFWVMLASRLVVAGVNRRASAAIGSPTNPAPDYELGGGSFESYLAGGQISSSPVIASDGTVYVTSDDGDLSAIK